MRKGKQFQNDDEKNNKHLEKFVLFANENCI